MVKKKTHRFSIQHAPRKIPFQFRINAWERDLVGQIAAKMGAGTKSEAIRLAVFEAAERRGIV